VVGSDFHSDVIISRDAFSECRDQPAMILRVKQACFREVLPKCAVDAGMFAKAEIALGKQRFGDVKHGIVGARRSELCLARQQLFGDGNGSIRFAEQSAGYLFHAGMASSRAFARKGVSSCNQSRSRTKTW